MVTNTELFKQEFCAYTRGVSLKLIKEGDIDTYVDEAIENWLDDHGVHIFHDRDASHFKFQRLVQRPYFVSAIGDIGLLNYGLLGIVGPRSPSAYSHAVIKELFEVGASYHYVTISGGAKGVDMMCHMLSLEYNVPTIVILGEGLRHALCSSKRDFLEQVVHAGGLIISEFPLDMKPSNWSFPQRNRIIAGLSECVFLPAAGVKSGSLLTVEYAMQMHVPVYTVPGSVYDATSRGTNEYLCEGKVSGIVNFSMIFEQFFGRKQSSSSNQSQIQLTDSQKNLMNLLPQSKEKLLAQGYLLADITLLELSGMICINASGEIMRK